MRIIILHAYAFLMLLLFPGSLFSQVLSQGISTTVTLLGFCEQEYRLTRTWTATNNCGHFSESIHAVAIEDNTSPVLMCGPVVSSIPCGTTPDFGIPVATDASDPLVSITYTDITRPGIFPQEYTVTRIWTATDNNGNTDVCSRTIFVEDIKAPVMACPVVVNPLEYFPRLNCELRNIF